MSDVGSKKWDAIILGGGIAGLGVARALLLKKKKVLVLEKTCEGASTLHASGILDPFVDLDFRSEILSLTIPALKRYPAAIRHLEKETGQSTGYQKYPLLYLAFSKANEKKLRHFQRLLGLKTEMKGDWLSSDQIRELEPRISSTVLGGLYFKNVARIIPAQLVRTLRAWLKKKGVCFYNAQGKMQLLVQNNRAEGIRVGSRSIRAENIVGCMGAWAGLQKKESGFHEPIEPLRGQIMIYPRKQPMRILLHTVDGGYLIPWMEGQVLAGSTVESVGFKPIVTRAGKQKIHNYAKKILPELDQVQPLQSWVGLRPRSLTHRPRIGKTRVSGYYVANGYFRNGILIGIYAGELLAQVILTGKSSRELRPFSPV